MLRIDMGDRVLFEGHTTNFERSGHGFLTFLASMGLDVTLVNKDYDDWYINSRFSIDT
jgi:hypothetical protein